MCGICGKLNTQGKAVPRSLMEQMTSKLNHRGPDDNGIFLDPPSGNNPLSIGLGHSRLSIMDLSKAGAQPMSNEDKTVWMVFNGEIYNFQELKRELISQGHQFSSQTDCEVILHLYEQEGIQCLSKLNGMFSFALWDQKKGELYLCRDRLGIKPLVYCWDGQSLIFASEIKSILCDPQVSKNINFDALNLYLTFNYIPAPLTIFEDIHKLKPGCYLAIKGNQLNIEKYWDIENKTSREPAADFESYKEQLYNLLEDAVKIRLMADVPLGAFLSGGIDSSIIVALMSRVSSAPVKTYSIGYDHMPLFDETKYARQLAELHNTDHHEIKLQSKDVLDVFTGLLSWFDEPFADSSAIPTFIVSKETRNHVKVALSGDGGDELFAGYRMYSGEHYFSKYKRIPSLLRKGIIEPLVHSFPDSRHSSSLEYVRRAKKFVKGVNDQFEDRFYLWNEIFNFDLRQSILKKKPESLNSGRKIIRGLLNHLSDDNINRMLYADLTHSLPSDMLNKVDWMSMKNSLEVRVPLLDHRVVELAFSMPGNIKMKNGKGKHILVETFKDLLPPSILKRPKRGFEVPISRWLQTDLKFLIDEHLSKEKIERQGIFAYAPIKDLIDSHLSNRSDTSWQLWNLIVFQAWKSNLSGH